MCQVVGSDYHERRNKMHTKLLMIAIFLGFASCNKYHGYKVYKVFSKSEAENQFLLSLEANEQYDFWSKVNRVGAPVSIMVSPEKLHQFEGQLNDQNIEFDVEIDNVETVIQAEKEYHRSKKALGSRQVSFDKYPTYDEIIEFLNQIAANNSDIVELKTIGRSYENRSLTLLRISSDLSSSKPVIFIDAGIHAREWIAPITAIYLIQQLVQSADLIQNVEWHILPLLNPDGYDYTHRVDRLWRKTRTAGIQCDGVDGNRNFAYEWGVSGSSKWECSDIYAGSAPFSVSETRSLQQYLEPLKTATKSYLTLHSYGSYLLYPWGYKNESCANWEELHKLGVEVIHAIGGDDKGYRVGGAAALLYEAAGAADDWARGDLDIPIVYTIELPGGGSYGFDLPPKDILEVVREMFEGLKVIGKHVDPDGPVDDPKDDPDGPTEDP